MSTTHTASRRPRWLALAIAAAMALVVGGCQDRAEQARQQAVAKRAADNAAADQAAAAFDDAIAKENWALAKAQGDVLLAQYPGTPAAARIRAQHAEAKARTEVSREAMRLAALWAYNVESVSGGQQLSAAIYSRDRVDTDGGGGRPVRLIFRDHPTWGRSSYLVLEAGDFDCYGRCRVQVKVDDKAATSMAGNRPKTDEAIAMFIDDERALWRMTRGARLMRIEFPVEAGGTRTAVFEVGGLDRSRLQSWN